MSFGSTWHNPLENVAELPSDTTLVTPLSRKAFRVTDWHTLVNALAANGHDRGAMFHLPGLDG